MSFEGLAAVHMQHKVFCNADVSPNIVRVIKIEKNEMGGECSAYWERKGVCRVLVGRTRLRWEDNIKMDLQQVGFRLWNGSSWLRIGQVAGTCECGNEPSGSIQCGEVHD